MTQSAVAALPEFKRLRGALLSVSGALVEIQRMHSLSRDDMGLFQAPDALYRHMLANASDVLSQREAAAKLTKRERILVRII